MDEARFAVNAGLVLNPTYTISPYAAVRIAILPTCALSVMRWNARGASAKANRSEMHGSRPFDAMARIIASRLSRGPQVTPCNRTCRITARGSVIEALAPERTPISAIVPPGRMRRSEASSVSAPPTSTTRSTGPPAS